ncbi:hypothetical protein CU052_23185 [Vibrio harveyi]|nr:hypothetical protein CU052_23185 [Vibrio harveyi]ODM51199.1 hypothetical protein BC455_08135 [Vibrio harveyi]RCR57494.1 hypothetical protein DTW68_26545 [Vibrio harveyi]
MVAFFLSEALLRKEQRIITTSKCENLHKPSESIGFGALVGNVERKNAKQMLGVFRQQNRQKS